MANRAPGDFQLAAQDHVNLSTCEALKDDVTAKFDAAKEVIDIELSRTRDAFDAR
jgi:hypothetical protein